MDKEAEEIANLTNVQRLNIIHNLNGRISRLEVLCEFLAYEIIKARMHDESMDRKTPYRKMLDLEEQFSNFLIYFNENLEKAKVDRSSNRYNKYIP